MTSSDDGSAANDGQEEGTIDSGEVEEQATDPRATEDADSIDPHAVVDADSIDASEPDSPIMPKKKATAVARPYPRRTLEDALRVPKTIRENNAGNPWPPSEVAHSLGMGMSSSFFYLTAAARDYGLTEGTREAQEISLTDLGRRSVYPKSAVEAAGAKIDAFLSVPVFAAVVDYYGGSNLPANEFVQNTLETKFGLDPRVHDEFLDLFRKNCRYAGVGADWKHGDTRTEPAEQGGTRPPATTKPVAAQEPATATGSAPVCFVVMPFVERTDTYATGFFDEVFASLIHPAVERAGFQPMTAKRQGSDVIHATIINQLIDADLVLADLTEHNPNVLFELGVRMALELPVALIRAKGTNPIFDVDNMLRVESYNPNIWPSSVAADLPRLASHIAGAWAAREKDSSYMSILRRS